MALKGTVEHWAQLDKPGEGCRFIPLGTQHPDHFRKPNPITIPHRQRRNPPSYVDLSTRVHHKLSRPNTGIADDALTVMRLILESHNYPGDLGLKTTLPLGVACGGNPHDRQFHRVASNMLCKQSAVSLRISNARQ
jgi:hypothetical protein